MNKIEKNVELAPYTTYKVGGPAKHFINLQTKQDLLLIFDWLKEHKEKVYILGGGSNVVISDKGINGLVVRMDNKKIELKDNILFCESGVSLKDAFIKTQAHNLSGLAWSFGIPQATIGGAIRGNAGAFGQNMKDIVEEVEAFDLKSGKFVIFKNKDCKFKYRESLFKKDKRYLVWSAKLKMIPSTKEEIEELASKSLDYRRNHHPRLPSAGSVFKNLERNYLRKVNKQLTEDLIKQGIIKYDRVGSGYFIDLIGLKGKAIGGAKISLEHANFVVNTGHAKASEIRELIQFIKKQIKTKFNIDLEEEVQYLGFDD